LFRSAGSQVNKKSCFMITGIPYSSNKNQWNTTSLEELAIKVLPFHGVVNLPNDFTALSGDLICLISLACEIPSHGLHGGL
jgi:hypothetical protein